MKKLWDKIKKIGIFKIILLILLIAAVIVGIRIYRSAQDLKAQVSQALYTVVHPEDHDIVKMISGSGTLAPANSYMVTTLVEGEILTSSFEEGDVVEKDSVLYTIDSSDYASNLERAQITLNQARRAYSDTSDSVNIKSTGAGQLVTLNIKAGDQIVMGQQIGVVRDTASLTLKVPFASGDAALMYAGQPASVMLDGSFETIPGTVSSVSGADTVGAGGMMTRIVSIAVANPGALTEGQYASAAVGGVSSSSAGPFEFGSSYILTSKTSGEVAKVSVSEGSYVKKDQVIAVLGGKDINESVQRARENMRSAELSLESIQDQIDSFTVKSPISGTIVDKSFKTGDKAGAGKVLCTIYDLSYLEMVLNIDELDIMDIAVGQSVDITADAIEGRTFSGLVTKVSVAGSTMNGVTSYPVTVRIDDISGLLPGMNVDADVIISEEEQVMAIPSAAVTRGNVVLVTAGSPSASAADTSMTAPEGYVYVPVVTGISDDEYVQILSGLTEEDEVAYIEQTAAGNSWINMFGGMAEGPGAPSSGRP
ncbi:MAG: HlyD family efflux transporter periplasmic adaptor subunit [Firmicutes bacterium]|nr:HlyD family efflux transporter periplasmic adaptor subunit [Bacillota bacterium]